MRQHKIWLAVFAALLCYATPSAAISAEIVAFWGFTDDYDFSATNPNKQDFMPDVDGTLSGDANLQAYLGKENQLDDNGGGGFVSYTSPISGITYAPTRTVKWDDLAGKGPEFDIDGTEEFLIDKLEGAGPEMGDFGDDALLYITLDGSGFADFNIRFDIEATPGDLPTSFDIFYRIGGTGATWFRDPTQNNIPLVFADYTPTADPDNQFADSDLISLSAMLNNADSIEIIINDFAENGDGEMEIDNIEITALSVPEPTAILLLLIGVVCVRGRSGN